MDKSKQVHVVGELKQIAGGLQKAGITELAIRHHNGPVYFNDGIAMRFTKEAIAKHHELVTKLLRNHGWSSKYSVEYLAKRLRWLYSEYIRQDDINIFSSGFDQIAEEYRSFNTEYTVRIPLDGISVKVPSFELGLVTLYSGVPKGVLPKVDNSTQKPSDPARPEAYAEISVIAEPIRAEELAYDACGRALDVLRYSSAAIQPNTGDFSIGFKNEVTLTEWRSVYLTEKGTEKILQTQRSPNILILEIDAAALETIMRIGGQQLSNILKKPQVNTYEDLILRSVRWYSLSQKATEVENKYLNLTTCLETFFTPKNNDPIAAAIAEGCAYFLADEVSERLRIYQSIKRLYRLRSTLSHGGKATIVDHELWEMENVVWNIIYRMILKISEFPDSKDFEVWLQKVKFSGSTSVAASAPDSSEKA